MTETTIWQLWDCSDCGEKGISCEHNRCTSCDHQRTFEEFDARYAPGTMHGDGTFTADHSDRVLSKEEAAALKARGLNWFCTNCQADNPGDATHCHVCEAPRDATEEEILEEGSYKSFETYSEGDKGATADLVEVFGPYAGMRAATGESFNMNDEDHETQLARSVADRNPFGREEALSASRPEWEPTDLPSSIEYEQEQAQAKKESPKVEEEPEPPQYSPSFREHLSQRVSRGVSFARRNTIALIAVPTGLLVVLFTIWAFSTNDYPGEVSSMSWEHRIDVEKWSQVTRSDWRYSLTERPERAPSNGSGERAGISILSCHEKHHHYERYQCGTQKVSCKHRVPKGTETYSCPKRESYTCGQTCTMRDNGNGSMSRTCRPKTCWRTVPKTCTRTKYGPAHAYDIEPKYCDRSITKPYCSYRTQEWRYVRNVQERGSHSSRTASPWSYPLPWPEPSLGVLERGVRRTSYQVGVVYDEGDGMVEKDEIFVENEAEFKQWTVGDPLTVTVRNLGGVVDINRRTVE